VSDKHNRLIERGVMLVDPGQTYVAPEVDPERISAGVVLYPGCRLHGSRTFLGPGALVGREGPATLVDSVLGERAVVESGFVRGAVLLRDARLGGNAHVREGTLLEEEASTAHAVGLKHTILLSFVTAGSLVNFCDVLMAGGSSRDDHSEVGSGFIHFNFTPWGKRGDKATASLVGDVVRGVFLREQRIFLGGAGGMIGPRSVGYGSVSGAGQVLRRDVPSHKLVVSLASAVEQENVPGSARKLEPTRTRNLAYIAQLVALRSFYVAVRLQRVPDELEHAHVRTVVQEAIATLDVCIEERCRRLDAFLMEHGQPIPTLELRPSSVCAMDVAPRQPYLDHVRWVHTLTAKEVELGQGWLAGIAAQVLESSGPFSEEA